MKRCRHADEYKAIRPPKCGCDACGKKWAEHLRELQLAAPDGTFISKKGIAYSVGKTFP